jgi:hypothetical protein
MILLILIAFDMLFDLFITLRQEEVVLKRCWLARYWGLAVQYGKLLKKPYHLVGKS